MAYSHLTLMQIQAETLFVHDNDGRLLFINEPVRPEELPAPLVFFGRTDGGCVCRCRHDLPPVLCHALQRLAALPDRDPLAANPALIGAVRQQLATAGLRIDGVFDGPAFSFPLELPDDGRGVVVDHAHAGQLARYFGHTIPELDAVQPCVVALVRGDAVAICRTVRRSTRAVEAGVETVVEHRGRGLGTAVVAKWASLVRAAGITPLYSTSWDNAASRGLAAKLKLVQYGTDLSFAGGKIL